MWINILKKSKLLAKLLKLRWPIIIQAPMAGGITTPRLVASVSNSGGLGSFATGYLKPEMVTDGIKNIKQLTNKPFMANLFVPNQPVIDKNKIDSYQKALDKARQDLDIPSERKALFNTESLPQDYFSETVEILLNEHVPVVSFTFGALPPEIIEKFKRNNTFLIGTATSLEEAEILQESGVDAITAQSLEAGGHRGGFLTPNQNSEIGMISLIPQLSDAIKLPIFAAGGIMDARGVMAAMHLGAAGVQMGTAFLCTKESGANPTYKKKLLAESSSKSDHTVLTSVFSGKKARSINTEFIKSLKNSVEEIPDYPIANTLSSPIRKVSGQQGNSKWMSLWAGQSVPLISKESSAESVLNNIYADIEESMRF